MALLESQQKVCCHSPPVYPPKASCAQLTVVPSHVLYVCEEGKSLCPRQFLQRNCRCCCRCRECGAPIRDSILYQRRCRPLIYLCQNLLSFPLFPGCGVSRGRSLGRVKRYVESFASLKLLVGPSSCISFCSGSSCL